MKQGSLSAGLIIGVLSLLIACESKKEAAKPVGDAALMSPAGSAGRVENDEGVGHYKQGHWNMAEGHFRKAIAVDPKLVEGRYNLGLTLDKMGKHEDATASFKIVVELAPPNSPIKDSVILKEHIGK
ncbi:MAG: tetratricopeptide repeat protein [Nitrospirae bacterium]|nr:MAG: tetratricopeptide repeat protein [Nitrospirota bacterium]